MFLSWEVPGDVVRTYTATLVLAEKGRATVANMAGSMNTSRLALTDENEKVGKNGR